MVVAARGAADHSSGKLEAVGDVGEPREEIRSFVV